MLLVLVLAAGGFVGVRLTTPDPAPAVTPVVVRTVHVPTQPITLPWPTIGQAAVAVPSIGVNVASGPEQPVPVASLTKLMTAYVVLHDHPLELDQPGPTITVSQADVDDYNNDTVDDDANAQVTLNEQITEQQVLGGLLVHSADNYADLLARWDAGSIPAFVAKMNADRGAPRHAALALRRRQRGRSGLAVDRLGHARRWPPPTWPMPTFASMVKMPSITLPVAGTISTYTPLLGLQGIIGVKSGFTNAAGGCDVIAVIRTVHGKPVLLLAAVTGQQGPVVLAQAGLHGLALVDALSPLIGSTSVVPGHQVAAHVTAAGTTVDARTASSASMLTWPGVSPTLAFQPARHLSDQARRGALVGTVVASLGTQRVAVPVRLDKDVPRPSLLQRLF